LSEMVKSGELRWASPGGPPGRRRAAAGLLGALALAGVAATFVLSAPTLTAAMGRSLALVGALACAAAAVWLWLDRPGAGVAGALAGVVLASLALPVLIAGGLVPALVLLAGGVALLWLLWSGGDAARPVAVVVPASLAAGFFFTFLHAMRYRSALFYQGSAAADSAAQLRALEAGQVAGLLTTFTIFLFLMLFLLSLVISWPAPVESRRPLTTGSHPLALGALAVLVVAALVLGARGNVRAVQADMVYKRGRPFDNQATRTGSADPASASAAWDAAIAIYEQAIARAPNEDFYYLFLGRALLERAGVSQNANERAELLTRAETLLLQAQDIAPLNTDHTANLARLSARWYAATTDPDELSERLQLAGSYYERALTLSPQNSVIRNELARLLLEVVGDCDRALAMYDESARIDPFYGQTHLARADAYIACGDPLPQAERIEHFRVAAESLDTALLLGAGNIRAWVQLAEVRRQLSEYGAADAALAQARLLNTPLAIPTAELDFLAAQIAGGRGDEAEARQLALLARETASERTVTLIDEFLASLDE
ncbi:MAG: tetratricopeptide repeat protein, partial [Candidatus Promineofilum sp.]|nr:tetratricopeptide repeat protein [Promineifilum sp.]